MIVKTPRVSLDVSIEVSRAALDTTGGDPCANVASAVIVKTILGCGSTEFPSESDNTALIRIDDPAEIAELANDIERGFVGGMNLLGDFEGSSDGILLGSGLGISDGGIDGDTLGVSDGEKLGAPGSVGVVEGTCDGD